MNKKIEFGSIQSISKGLGETFDIIFSHSKEMKKEIELFIKIYEKKIGYSDENHLKNIKSHITDSIRIYESCYDNTNHLDEILELIKSSNDISKSILQMKDQYMKQRKENRLRKEKIEGENINMFLSMKQIKKPLNDDHDDDKYIKQDSSINNNNNVNESDLSSINTIQPSDLSTSEDNNTSSLSETNNIESQDDDSSSKNIISSDSNGSTTQETEPLSSSSV